MTVRGGLAQAATLLVAAFGCLLCVAWIVGLSPDPGPVLDPLTLLLAAFGVVSNLFSAKWNEWLEISGSLVAALVAAAFLGPAAAFTVVLIVEGVSWAFERLSPIALPLNVATLGIPAVAAAAVLNSLVPEGPVSGLFYAAFAATAMGATVLNVLLFWAGSVLRHGRGLRLRDVFVPQMLPVWGINIVLTVLIGEIYAEVGISIAALLLASILALSYQLRLVAEANERTRQYASLSWGVLSGMIRNLDMRDARTARHCAAVAQFARDIAAEAGLPGRDQELAHTAGLLHDVGKFALSDRALERGVQLTDTDWKGIKRHPELGAAMLKDVGGFGPIAEIVRTHHERPDGRGYPAGLEGDQIPEVAKVVAVAELYDTFTSEDTYRSPMSSFEALNELRRVSGRQVDARYVEALARVLRGTGTDYRHAGAADFDRELDLERRISEAAGVPPRRPEGPETPETPESRAAETND